MLNQIMQKQDVKATVQHNMMQYQCKHYYLKLAAGMLQRPSVIWVYYLKIRTNPRGATLSVFF